MSKEVSGLDNSLEEGFDSLGLKGPIVRGIIIVPSYAKDGVISAEYCQYWDDILMLIEGSCKQVPPDMVIGQIKSTY